MEQIVSELYQNIRSKVRRAYSKEADFLRLLDGRNNKKAESWRTMLIRCDRNAKDLSICEALHLCAVLGESLPEMLIAAKMKCSEYSEKPKIGLAAEEIPDYGEKKAANH